MRLVSTSFLIVYALVAQAVPPPHLRPPEGTTIKRDVPYARNGHERQVLDLYLPNSENPLPLVIWIHGGGWQSGSKERGPALQLLREGYAVASINYRLSHHAIFPAQIQDCKAAVRFLRAHAKEYNLDPRRFGAWGASAGGHLVALLAVTGDTKQFDTGEYLDQSSRVQAVVDYFGPTHFFLLPDQDKDSLKRFDREDSPESRLIGGSIVRLTKEARAASPMTYISKGDAPMLLVHGDQDPVVPYEQSVAMDSALRKAGIESELVTVEGGGHGQGIGLPELQKVKSFLARHLKPET